MEKKFVVLQPQYMRDFQCIGAACTDTCCSGWQVSIDRPTYKKYRKIKDRSIAEKVSNFLVENDNPTEEAFAYIKLNDDRCGFLDQGLCGLQLNYGEEYLSKTCLVYPRVLNHVDDRLEMSAKLSCPEAAKLSLLNEDIMEFDIVECNLNSRYNISRAVNTEGDSWRSSFWDIRTFVIDLLQNRKYSISERMILLGMFCNRLHEASILNDKSAINKLISEYSIKIDNPQMRKQISKLPTANHVQIKLLMELMENRRTNHARFNEYTNQLKEAFLLDSLDQRRIEERFKLGQVKYYRPFMVQHSYILENYLVNLVFERLFLFDPNFSVMDDYILLVAMYSTIRFYLQGVAAFNERMTAEEAVAVIQACVKNIEHDGLYLKRITDFIKSVELDLHALLIVLVNE
ncbi:hypothetical protein BBD41_16635 [Paenibacillus ihbetae]|uniref:Lysine-N-methylase n=1 Tax=Paenibacillus ihbetae TaxID=1870820 RepID=A0A1B2E254_9BACL|nr:flagellin lysine-N-methylase [Paenibacillus ihbetae]ANY74076.1 hypothetical protein BBD41_16635 [Paenibacillus ihbetae]